MRHAVLCSRLQLPLHAVREACIHMLGGREHCSSGSNLRELTCYHVLLTRVTCACLVSVTCVTLCQQHKCVCTQMGVCDVPHSHTSGLVCVRASTTHGACKRPVCKCKRRVRVGVGGLSLWHLHATAGLCMHAGLLLGCQPSRELGNSAACSAVGSHVCFKVCALQAP